MRITTTTTVAVLGYYFAAIAMIVQFIKGYGYYEHVPFSEKEPHLFYRSRRNYPMSHYRFNFERRIWSDLANLTIKFARYPKVYAFSTFCAEQAGFFDISFADSLESQFAPAFPATGCVFCGQSGDGKSFMYRDVTDWTDDEIFLKLQTEEFYLHAIEVNRFVDREGNVYAFVTKDYFF